MGCLIDGFGTPNEVRFFVHKRLIGAAKSFVTSGFNPLAAARGFIAPVSRATRVAQVTQATIPAATRPRLGFTACGGGSVIDPRTGACVSVPTVQSPLKIAVKAAFQAVPVVAGIRAGITALRGRPGGVEVSTLGGSAMSGGGEAVMGRYGAALVPGSKIIDRADCTFGGTVRGMILGDDNLCYNRGQISNKQRAWPRGRRPLLTGGDMRAISIASRAARRLTNTAVRLHEIGLIKKPIARKPRKKKD